MSATRNTSGVLTLGGVALPELARDPRIGTPAYVYYLDAMALAARALIAAFEGTPHLVAYAVKANSAGDVIRALAAEGCGADVVSGGELLLARRCGIPARKILFSGVAKRDDEIDLAIGEDIGALQVESVEELARIAARAKALGRRARVSLRVNPGVDADALDTHSYIATGHDEAKFGVALSSIGEAITILVDAPEVLLVGVGAHVGSQFTKTDAYLTSAGALFGVAKELRSRFALEYVDTGGGFGVDYGDGCEASPADFVTATRALKTANGLDDLALYCEPGRSLVATFGVLLASVIQRKVVTSSEHAEQTARVRRWTMIDAGMNDLLRPALYQARHRIVPLVATDAPSFPHRVVGPVCESSDDFGIHDLPDDGPDAPREVAILDAGAYGYSMASRYNGRALPTEVFLRGGAIANIRARKPPTDWVDDRA